MNASELSAKPMVPKSGGFVLPTVLVTISVVTLIFLVAMTALASLTREAAEARARARFLQHAMSVEARLTYLAVTERLSPTGIWVGAPLPPGEFQSLTQEEDAAFRVGMATAQQLRFDGRPYRVGSEAAVRVQDQAGLINITRLSGLEMERLMSRLGATSQEARSLSAALLDYIDPDAIPTLNGAEAAQYPAGASGPANRPLRSPDEFLSVLGARDAIDQAAWRALRPALASDHLAFRRNVNTAGSDALQILFGMTERQARTTITARESNPFNTLDEVVALTGAAIPTDVEIAPVFASGRSVYSVQDFRSRWTYTGRLITTPSHPERPFWIDLIDLGVSHDITTDLEDAPEFPTTPR